MKKISVVVPVYNSSKYLGRCIESILGQTYRNLEIILVNDGSTDNSEEICKKYEELDDRVIFINRENHGVSNARNEGIKKATGSYLTFVDSDDWIEEDMYSAMIQKIEKNNVDFCVCGICRESEDGKWEQNIKNGVNIEAEDKEYFLNRIYALENITFNLWNMIVKREKVSNLYFDEDIWLSEDNLYILKMLIRVNCGTIVEEIYYHYVQYKESLSHKVGMTEKKFSELLAVKKQSKILKKHNKNIYAEYKHVILWKYMNVCKMMVQSGCKRKKWVWYLKNGIFKELISGGTTCKKHNNKLILNGSIVVLSYNIFYYIYRKKHKDEILYIEQ